MKNRIFAFILLITSSCNLVLGSSDKISSLAVDELRDFQNYDLITIYDSVKVFVQETGLSYVSTHRLYKVLTPKGAKRLAVIKYDYDPQSAYVEIQKILIHHANGNTEEPDMKHVLDYPAPARAIYWGAREKMIEVGRLEPGDLLEVFLFRKGFTYALLQDDDDKYIPPMRGHFYDIIEFWSNDPILEKVYIVNIPKDKPLQYEFYNGEVRSSIHFRGDRTIYTFTKNDIFPFHGEPGMVAYSDVAPKLLLSTSPDWKAKSLWFYGVNEDYGSFEYTPEIKAKVDLLLKKAKNEMDSISILTHWAADEIRYSGLSMGEGEGYTLHKGDMTFTDRCGVCKDKAGMLVTMLRAAGFESYPAMTMAGSRIDYIPADQFNHSVTLVKLSNGDYKLLDPTWVPFIRELWSSAEQQQNYLMGVPEGADLAITPISPPENHYFRISGTSKIFTDGTYEGALTLAAEGQSDASIRGMFTRSSPAIWKDLVEEEMRRVAPKVNIQKMEFGNPYDYMSGPVTVSITYSIPDYAIVTDQEIIFHPLVLSNLFKRGMTHLYYNTDLEKRNYAFRDRCSRLVELNEKINLPAGYEAIRQNYNKSSKGSSASFSGGIIQEGNILNINISAIFNKRIYDPEDWTSYRLAVLSQNEFAEIPVILIKTK